MNANTKNGGLKMDEVNTTYQIETIKAQCRALETKGFNITLNFYKLAYEQRANVVIMNDFKLWKFSDPDLNIIISQICKLSSSIKNKQNTWRINSYQFKG